MGLVITISQFVAANANIANANAANAITNAVGSFLKFVTSCSRQPLLGFKQLNPAFCIQKVPAYASQYSAGMEAAPSNSSEAPRLPTAATCMNLLKLPQYDSTATLREKLLYAVRSNSGFELS